MCISALQNFICLVNILATEGLIGYASDSLVFIFLPWYNGCSYALYANNCFWIELKNQN